MKKGKHLVIVYPILFYAVLHCLNLFLPLYLQNMAKNEWCRLLSFFLVRYHCMHPEQPLLIVVDLLGVRVSCWSNNVCHFGVFLWKISCKVHFFPPELLLPFNSGKPELWTQAPTLDKVEETIWDKNREYFRVVSRFRLDGFWEGTSWFQSVCSRLIRFGAYGRIRDLWAIYFANQNERVMRSW